MFFLHVSPFHAHFILRFMNKSKAIKSLIKSASTFLRLNHIKNTHAPFVESVQFSHGLQ